MDPAQALAFAGAVPELRWVKVGLELFVAGGPAVVQQLRDQGQRVFLDLKFHDIPATMAGACRSAARLGAELITVHACAGSEARRQIQGGGVKLDGQKLADPNQEFAGPEALAGKVLQLGKKTFRRLVAP